MRNNAIKSLIRDKGFLRIIEAHNGLSALIADQALLRNNNGELLSFDGFWESSLTDSASKGLPDIEIVTLESRLETISQILQATSKPLIVDGDTGGDFNHFEYMVNKYEDMGASMIIIEDKVFPKRNSLTDSTHTLEDINKFAEKIKRGIAIRKNNEFMIVARLEGLIAGYSTKETLERAEAFLKAGADGIMIHSKKTDAKEVLDFAALYRKLPKNLTKEKILVCVPTTYNRITAKELASHGFNIIIYANHLLRSSYKAMEEICKTILLNDRSCEGESLCVPLKKLFKITEIKKMSFRGI
ncbi:phosphoenolpyruvate mutase [Candidatus Daviesbacteria bacterium RIFCSPLOWO2_02_FULL_38_18]|nr:MAG: phosphoenolpyruvate mutase [Candidatus Daviesbacteria bacterium RIFCSPLOWO2_02_FULL_38_18]OGE73159.1 MAG: phosphoenolpyruvate mutase [Candidatus Daviesbacteria bacterium RIFCSPLOWO2_12_FULL_38_10]